jgi:ribosomal protein L3 glutamine methyltransferase
VGTLVADAHARFKRAGLAFGHGSESAWDEAVYLVLHALDLPLDRLTPFLSRSVTRAELRRVQPLIDARIRERVPAAYLTHEAWLGDLRFYVDERVIVPRSFIAELLRERLAPWLPRSRKIGRALDLCTGSACLAVLLAKTFPRVHGRRHRYLARRACRRSPQRRSLPAAAPHRAAALRHVRAAAGRAAST